MKNIRSVALAFLDKVDQLLTSEPARLILYGSAAVIFIVAKVMADRGYLNVAMTFEQAVTAGTAALATLVIIVESVRRFVYSPQTYIENLSDEAAAAHEAAHMEEEMRAWMAAVAAKKAAAAQAETITTVPIGPADTRTDN